VREGAQLVFHAAPRVERNAVARFMGENLGAVLDSLFIGRRRFRWCGHVGSVVDTVDLVA
jgi:hypothetical protein